MVEGVGCFLGNLSAGIADQECYRLMGVMSVPAGEERVARSKPMDPADLDEEVERPVDRDRSRTPAGLVAQKVDQLICTDRTPFARENVQNALTSWRHTADVPLMFVRVTVWLAHRPNIRAAGRESKIVFSDRIA